MPAKFKPKKSIDLTPRQGKFVEEFLKHGNKTLAAKVAGYTGGKMAGPKVAKSIAVQAALDEARAKSISVAAYTAEVAMQEADEAIKFARETGNANAYVKAVELKSKLKGLLIEKHQHMGLAPLQITISGIDDPKPAIEVHSTSVMELPDMKSLELPFEPADPEDIFE